MHQIARISKMVSQAASGKQLWQRDAIQGEQKKVQWEQKK